MSWRWSCWLASAGRRVMAGAWPALAWKSKRTRRSTRVGIPATFPRMGWLAPSCPSRADAVETRSCACPLGRASGGSATTWRSASNLLDIPIDEDARVACERAWSLGAVAPGRESGSSSTAAAGLSGGAKDRCGGDRTSLGRGSSTCAARLVVDEGRDPVVEIGAPRAPRHVHARCVRAFRTHGRGERSRTEDGGLGVRGRPPGMAAITREAWDCRSGPGR